MEKFVNTKLGTLCIVLVCLESALPTNMSSVKVERVADIPSLELGEGPHWDDKKQCLYLVDIFGKAIHKYDPALKKHTSATFDDFVSVIIPVKNKKDQFVVSLGREIALISWDGTSNNVTNIQKIGEVDQGTENRFNDGKCDPSGRLWIGTMGPEPENGHVPQERGSFFSVEGQKIKKELTKVGISNGLAWNTALKKMYYIDTQRQSIDQFDYNTEDGTIKNRTPVFTLSKHQLLPGGGNKSVSIGPDGMTIDADGNLWVALFNANSVIKIDPRKPETLLQRIEIPAKQVTSVAFGGTNLDELYVTTARFTIDGLVLPPPVHGSVYKVTGLGVIGLPADEFLFN